MMETMILKPGLLAGKVYPLLPVYQSLTAVRLLLLLTLLWCLGPILLRYADSTSGSIDQSIWLLVLLSLISFLLLTGLCWWLLQRLWTRLGLTPLTVMVSQFNTLTLWQQLSFYLASFVCLLWAATASLAAIC